MTKPILTGPDTPDLPPLRICPTHCSVLKIFVCLTCVFCVFPTLPLIPSYLILYKTGIWPFLFLCSGDHWFCLLPHFGCSRYRMPCTQQKIVEGLHSQTCSYNCKNFILYLISGMRITQVVLTTRKSLHKHF